MKLTKLNSDKTININVARKKINWNAPSKSKPQKLVKDFFRIFWEGKYICVSEFRIPGSLLRWDLVNFNKYLIIEFDGSQHDNYNKFFFKNRLGYLNSIKRDVAKEKWAEKNGFTVIRLIDDDLENLSPEFFEERFGVNIL